MLHELEKDLIMKSDTLIHSRSVRGPVYRGVEHVMESLCGLRGVERDHKPLSRKGCVIKGGLAFNEAYCRGSQKTIIPGMYEYRGVLRL